MTIPIAALPKNYMIFNNNKIYVDIINNLG